MARTKADAGKKAGGKAPRKAPVLRTTPAPKAGGVSKRKRGAGGSRSSYCKRPVPNWQLPIGDFLMKSGSAAAGSSKEDVLEKDDMELGKEGVATTSASACGNAAAKVEEASDSEGVYHDDDSMGADESDEDTAAEIEEDVTAEIKEGGTAEVDVDTTAERKEEATAEGEGCATSEDEEDSTSVCEEDSTSVGDEDAPDTEGVDDDDDSMDADKLDEGATAEHEDSATAEREDNATAEIKKDATAEVDVDTIAERKEEAPDSEGFFVDEDANGQQPIFHKRI